MKKTIALFDFDGTITHRDTLFEFIKYQKGRFSFVIGFLVLSPFLLIFKAGFMPNWKAKQIVLKYFFAGIPLGEFQKACDSFALNVIPRLVRPKALQAIEDFKKQNTKVIVITASAENWVKGWCDLMQIECLATKLEVIEGRITGNILGINCHGKEKVERINQHIQLKDYDEIHAYGDSKGDVEMLSLATNKYYKPFCD